MNSISRTFSIALTMVILASGFWANGTPVGATTLDLNGSAAFKKWGKTASVQVSPQAEWLEINGNGWDSRMFLPITLQPGHYQLTATGKGKKVFVKLLTDLGKSNTVFQMNISAEGWRTDEKPFVIDKTMSLFLIIHLLEAGKSQAMIKQIKIERCVSPRQDTTTQIKELAEQPQIPELVRGCTFRGGPEKSFTELRNWNANIARSWLVLKPTRYVDGLAEYASGWEKQLEPYETYLEGARKAGFKVIFTVESDAFMEKPRNWEGWNNPRLPQAAAKLWRDIAKRLLPYRDVIYGYDLCNEPLDWDQLPYQPKQWRSVALAAIKAIREVDRETWVVYESGPGGGCNGFWGLEPLPDNRIIYSAHFYSPAEFTHQGIKNIKNTDLAKAMTDLNVKYPAVINGVRWDKAQIRKMLEPLRQFQLKYHVPVLIGEFSVIRWAPPASAAQYLTDLIDIFEEYRWSWIYHAFREYEGWSVEYDEKYPIGGVHPVRAPYETGRAKVLKAGLAKNLADTHANSSPKEDAAMLSVARRIATMATTYDEIKQKGGKAIPSAQPLARAKEIMVENAVYPVIYSPVKRMNGVISDWDDIPFVGRLSTSLQGYAPSPTGFEAWFKAAVTDDMLYILAVAKDQAVNFACGYPGYNNDCFEIFLDPFFSRRSSYDDSHVQIFVTATDRAGKSFSASGKIPVTVKPVQIAGGWGVELAIPLSNDYFNAMPFNGLPLGFNISYNNNDNGKSRQYKSTWSYLDQDDTSWNDPAVFGVMQVVSAKNAAVNPVQQGKAIAENQRLRNSGETLSDPSILARERPSPQIIRGFMAGDLKQGKSFDDMRAWGANAIRLTLDHPGIMGVKHPWQPGNMPNFLDRLENTVKQADRAGLKVIPVVFEIPLELKGRDPWTTPEVTKAFQEYWKSIASRLKPYKQAIWAYDLYNEPLRRSQLPYAPLEWRKMAIDIIKAIREVDPDTWIIYEVGPGGGWRGFEDLKPLPDPHVIYSFHMYTPGPFTHQGIAATQLQDAALLVKAQKTIGIKYPGLIGGIYWDRQTLEQQLQPVIDFQKKWQVPIYVGEFSVIAWAPVESSVNYLTDITDLCQKHGWSWTYHAFREYQGWSLEHEEGVSRQRGQLALSPHETERAKVIKRALSLNKHDNQ